MAGLTKLAKLGNTLWKGISYLPKKAHKLQQPFVAPTGGTLTKGQKVANGIFKTTKTLAIAGAATSLVGFFYNDITSKDTDDHKEYEKYKLNASKCMDVLIGSIGGFILGGPVGALALGTAAFLISKDLVIGNAVICKHGKQSLTISQVRQLRAQEAEEVKKEEQPKPVEQNDAVPAAPADSVPAAPARPVAPADSVPAAPAEPEQPAQQTPPSNNLFGGTINEIQIKEYKVKDSDCLWNIAKHELQKANPGATITNGQILVQVKEFIRLNPQIKNPDLIYANQKIKTAA